MRMQAADGWETRFRIVAITRPARTTPLASLLLFAQSRSCVGVKASYIKFLLAAERRMPATPAFNDEGRDGAADRTIWRYLNAERHP